MELLKALGMPFHLASVLFVATSSLLLALILGVGGPSTVLAIFAIWLQLVWLTRFAFTLIDDAANGEAETAAASVEMLNPFGDPRCWVHPLLAVAIGGALFFRPAIPLLPVLAAAATLFPASIGAIAISGRARDALNPFAMAHVVRGLGWHYALAVVAIGLCAGAGLLVAGSGLWSVVRIALLELLLLLVYAGIGGLVYARRIELGFEPRVSPERRERRASDERDRERQRMIDGLYRDLRVRESGSAIAAANAWLQGVPAIELRSEVQAILAAGASWSEPRGFSLLLRGMLPQLVAMKQLPLALTAAEAGLQVQPAFAPAGESEAVALIGYARHTGRRRVAATLLANYLASNPGQREAGPALAALRDEMQRAVRTE